MDPDLTERGIEQVMAAASFWKEAASQGTMLSPYNLDKILCSPSKRALRTLDTLFSNLDIPVSDLPRLQIEDDLREKFKGSVETQIPRISVLEEWAQDNLSLSVLAHLDFSTASDISVPIMDVEEDGDVLERTSSLIQSHFGTTSLRHSSHIFQENVFAVTHSTMPRIMLGLDRGTIGLAHMIEAIPFIPLVTADINIESSMGEGRLVSTIADPDAIDTYKMILPEYSF